MELVVDSADPVGRAGEVDGFVVRRLGRHRFGNAWHVHRMVLASWRLFSRSGFTATSWAPRGILVDDERECAEAVVRLLRDPALARALGERGKNRVREHFLIPRLILNELRLMQELVGGRPVARPAEWMRRRDPVCGMMLGEAQMVDDTIDGFTCRFCSELCHMRFRENPAHYLGALRHEAAPPAHSAAAP